MTKSRDSPKAPKLLEASQAPRLVRAYAMQPKKPWEVALRDSQGKEIEEAIFARVSGDAFGSAGAADAEYVAAPLHPSAEL
jgi:hypothetical protein